MTDTVENLELEIIRLRAELAKAKEYANSVSQEAADLITRYCNERDKLREALERAREALIRISEKDTNADIVNGLEEGPCARIADKAIGAIADVLRETGVLDE